MRETVAVVKSYGAACGHHESNMMRELLERSPAAAIRRPVESAAVRGEAVAALRRAADALDRGATDAERSEYRRFVLDLGRRDSSSREGAWDLLPHIRAWTRLPL